MIQALTAVSFTAPSLNYFAVSPILIVFGAAVVGVLVEAFTPRAARYTTQVTLSVAGLLAALIMLVLYVVMDGTSVTTAAGSVAIDHPTLFLQATILVLSLLAVLIMLERTPDRGGAFAAQTSSVPGSDGERAAERAGLVQTEVYPLTLLSVGGMMIFPAANDLLTMFVALEVLSLPLYLLCGMARRRRLLSQESSMKYFLLGSFASAFFLYGAALIYGYAGSLRLADIAAAIDGTGQGGPIVGRDGLLLLGAILLAVGLLFKISAAPFHAWTPDVYQGAPTPVTGFMAACTKVAAFGALLRLAYVALPGLQWDWQPVMFGVAILTMIVGSVVAILQTDVKRMLGYSAIAHAGFLLVGVVAMNRAGVSGVLFYLLAYGFASIGAFALVTMVRTISVDGSVGGEATHLKDWEGIGRRSPLIAALFTVFLLAFAGIPLTSGFISKYSVFSAALASGGDLLGFNGGGALLVVVGVLTSAIAAFFYIRVIVVMFFGTPAPEAGTTVALGGAATTFTVFVGAAVTVLLGVYPGLVLDIATKASTFLP